MLFALHFGCAWVLFFLINWIGQHAVDFGYRSTTLFEEPNESVALNFFLRALSPAVFLIAVSAIVVAMGYPHLRIDIYWVALYYYVIRAAVIVLLNRHRLISWTRYAVHSLVGVGASLLAYKYFILPNRSLIPNLDTAGNELWLAIFAFLYAVANKIPLSGGPGDHRRNEFIRRHYEEASRRFGALIDRKIEDEILKLTAYSILIYEDYSRPSAIRSVERLMAWKPRRTTGIMQVAADRALSDRDSVELGTNKLVGAWEANRREGEWISERVRAVVADYNRDENYIGRVFEVMEILAVRIAPSFSAAYDKIWTQDDSGVAVG